MNSLDRWFFSRYRAARPLKRRAMLVRMGYTLDPDGTVRPTQYTKFRIVKPPPGSGEIFIIDGDPLWYQPSRGAALIPFYGPYVAEWLEWRAEQGAIVRRG